jgi:hypothetical protein
MKGHAELATSMRQSLLGRFKAPLRIGVCHWWAGCGFLICTGPYTILQELLDTLRVSRFANPWIFGRGRLRSNRARKIGQIRRLGARFTWGRCQHEKLGLIQKASLDRIGFAARSKLTAPCQDDAFVGAGNVPAGSLGGGVLRLASEFAR